MKRPATTRTTPKPKNAEPAFDRNFPSNRLKKRMNPKTAERRTNEIDATERTLTKFLMKSITAHSTGSRLSALGSRDGSGLGLPRADSRQPTACYSGPLIPPSLRTLQK